MREKNKLEKLTDQEAIQIISNKSSQEVVDKIVEAKAELITAETKAQLAEANIHANFVDLALPGMLPVLNEECLNIAILSSLALNGQIPPFIKFDRKHYFYADLPQGY
jgi:aspartyl-tRNA(Asn)/glutamyl-tRNA(Gln) amidotransferase subunit B